MEIQTFDDSALTTLMLSLGGLGALLIVGVLVRMWVPLARRLFLPASLIGGMIGLLLGPFFLGGIPSAVTETWAGLAGVLISIVFAPMLLGQRIPKLSEVAEEAGPQVWMAWFSSSAQVAVPALLVYFVFQRLTNTDPLFSSIFEASWSGGHGTAAGMAQAWSALGWEDGSSLALGSATVSLIFGIIVGTILVNVGARKGHLKYIDTSVKQFESDFIKEDEQAAETTGRLKGQSLSNIGFHFSLILIAILIGAGLKMLVDQVLEGVPLFPLAMIGGVLVHVAIRRTKIYDLVDKPTLNAISAVFLDFLVVAAVASLAIPVIMENWIALVAIMLMMAVVSVTIVYFLAPRVFKKDWFENALVQFGTQTGVVAIALLLLRMADPHMKSNGYRALALSRPFVSPFIGGGLVTALVPILVIEYGNFWVGVATAIFCLLLIPLAMLLGMWRKPARKRRASQTW